MENVHWSQFRHTLMLWGGLNGYLFIPALFFLASGFSINKLIYLVLMAITCLVIEKVFKYQYPYIRPALRMKVFGSTKYSKRGRRKFII